MPRSCLVVDDSPIIRMTLEQMLIRLGIPAENVFTVENGEVAMEVFYAHQPDVVFMDIQMPGMDGEEAASRMLAEKPETKVVVLTGASMEDKRVRNLRSLGAFDLREKPIRSDDLDEILRLIDSEDSGAGRIH